MRGVFVVGCVALLVAVASARAQGDVPRVAVLPLRAEGLQLHDATRLNALVRAELSARSDVALQSEELTNGIVEASQGLGVDCDLNAARCGAELGRLADVDLVIVGRLTHMDAAVAATLRVVDVKSARERRSVTGLLPWMAEDQQAPLAALVALVLSDAPLGSLAVTSNAAGASIVVDGAQAGVTPLAAPVGSLAPGVHRVRVEKKGALPFAAEVRVEAGAVTALDAPLALDPEAVRATRDPVALAVPFVVGGAGALVAIVGGVLIGVGVQPWNRIQDNEAAIGAADPGARDYPTTVRDLRTDSERAAADWASYGQASTVTGAVLVGGGALAALGGTAVGVLLLAGAPPDEGALEPGAPAAGETGGAP